MCQRKVGHKGRNPLVIIHRVDINLRVAKGSQQDLERMRGHDGEQVDRHVGVDDDATG